MKIYLSLATLMVAAAELNALLAELNSWVELGIKVAGLAAALGAAWRWLIGPGWQRGRVVLGWVREQLELISTLNERLQKMEDDLARGAKHFERLDAALEALTTEEAQAVRRAIHTREPVELLPDGAVERREPLPES